MAFDIYTTLTIQMELCFMTVSTVSCPESPLHVIGTVAGKIWHYLNEHERVSLSKLAKELDVPRDEVMQGIGWLAREGNVVIEQEARGKYVSLQRC